MKLLKNIAVTAVTLSILSGLLAGCANSNVNVDSVKANESTIQADVAEQETEAADAKQEAAEASENTESDDLYDEIIKRGYLIVGTEGTYAPNTYHNEDGELVGFDVEVAALVAKHLGVDVRYEETEWASIFAALDSGQIDVIVNEVGYTDERAEKYDFSDPYAFVKAAILTRADDDSIKSFEDLDGKIAANEATSLWGENVHSAFANSSMLRPLCPKARKARTFLIRGQKPLCVVYDAYEMIILHQMLDVNRSIALVNVALGQATLKRWNPSPDSPKI